MLHGPTAGSVACRGLAVFYDVREAVIAISAHMLMAVFLHYAAAPLLGPIPGRTAYQAKRRRHIMALCIRGRRVADVDAPAR